MELDEAMRTAATVRYYRPDPVPDEVLHRVLDTARFAPNGGNRQAWRVISVSDPATRSELRDLYLEPWQAYTAHLRTSGNPPASLEDADNFASRLHEVPLHLVVCAHLPSLALTDSDLDRPSIVGGASIYPFVQNLLLACRANGLGAALTTILAREEPRVKDLLAIPDEFAMACLVAVGYPEEARLPKRLRRAPVEEFTYRDRFGDPFVNS